MKFLEVGIWAENPDPMHYTLHSLLLRHGAASSSQVQITKAVSKKIKHLLRMFNYKLKNGLQDMANAVSIFYLVAAREVENFYS